MPEPLRDALAGGHRLVGTVLTLPARRSPSSSPSRST
jgi:hypothetical protein